MTSIPYRQLNSSAGEIRLLTILPESYSLLTSPPTSGGTAPAQQAGHKFDSNSNDPWDNAVSELVEMGYSATKARQALTESEAGIDISAAIEWLTFDAQWEMRLKEKKALHGQRGELRKRKRRTRMGVIRLGCSSSASWRPYHQNPTLHTRRYPIRGGALFPANPFGSTA
jgi:hypothetical protein